MASTKTSTSSTSGRDGSGRLPSTRERRPALAALAVLLILGGALASAWLAMRAGDRAEYMRVKEEVGTGQVIKESQLTTVDLPEDFEGGVLESDMDDIVGKRAATPWTPGMVVSDSMVVSEKEFDDSVYQFALPVESGLAPLLSAGTNVAVYSGAGSGPVAGTVATDTSSSADDSGSDGASAVINVPASCGTEVINGLDEDAVYIAIAATPDTKPVRDSC